MSNKIGEGHNNFALLDVNNKSSYPDYQKISIDILFKYKGLSILGEFINATGNKIQGLHHQNDSPLQPKEISQYLYLGNGCNVEISYLFPKNWAIENRYSVVLPEWNVNNFSLSKISEVGLGVAKYMIDNRLKFEISGNYYKNYKISNENYWLTQLGMHVIF